MCDYSLEGYASRAAVNGEDLVVKSFPSGTHGFVADSIAGRKRRPEKIIVLGNWATNDCAVCCKPGVEMILHLEGPHETRHPESVTKVFERPELFSGETPVVFHKRTNVNRTMHKDGFITPSGRFLLLQDLPVGTRATVTKALPTEIVEAAKGEKAFKPEDEVGLIEAPAPRRRRLARMLFRQD